MWKYAEGHCYGIVSVEVPYQEALIACTTSLNSTLAKLPLNMSDTDSLQRFHSLIQIADTIEDKKYWLSGMCKFGINVGIVPRNYIYMCMITSFNLVFGVSDILACKDWQVYLTGAYCNLLATQDSAGIKKYLGLELAARNKQINLWGIGVKENWGEALRELQSIERIELPKQFLLRLLNNAY